MSEKTSRVPRKSFFSDFTLSNKYLEKTKLSALIKMSLISMEMCPVTALPFGFH
jgi:hypothetical protein